MAKKEDKYCIEAYPYTRPETVERGVLEKGLGQSTIAGATINVLNRRAEVGIPNWTEAWGVRIDVNGAIPESPLDIKDPKYKGQIKELKWGDPKGCLIVCRYLRGYNTIDQQYQDVILNAKDSIKDDTEASADAFYIRIQSGDNYYDPESDKYLVQMFKMHYMNQNSEHKDPNSQSFMFREKDFDAENPTVKIIDEKFEAIRIVKDAASDNTLEKLRNLKSVLGAMVEIQLKDEDIYSYLGLLADSKSKDFLFAINNFKRTISDTFEKAKSYNVLDLTKNGHIAAGELKKDVIGSDIPGKGDGMLDWVMENFLDPKAYDVIHRLKNITDKLK